MITTTTESDDRSVQDSVDVGHIRNTSRDTSFANGDREMHDKYTTPTAAVAGQRTTQGDDR